MKKIILVLSFLGLSCATTQAFIYEVKVLRRWNDTLNRYQYVIGLSDFHDKTHAANAEQKAFLQGVLASLNPQGAKILVEDISSDNAQGRRSCGNFRVESKGGILGGLTAECKNAGLIDVENAEYRYSRVIALGPVLNNIAKSAHDFPSTKTIKVADLLHEINGTVDEVKAYADHEVLKEVAHNYINDVHAEIKELRMHTYKNKSVADYLASFSQDKLAMIKRLLTFDSALLDLKLINSVNATQDKHTIMIVAGGSHVERTSAILEQLGYEKVHETGVHMEKEYDLSRSIGCEVIDNQYFVRPKPADISVVSRFI